MVNSLWRLIPGRKRKAWKLEKRRVEVLSSITGDRLRVELMAQRPRLANDPLSADLLNTVLQRFAEIATSAKAATLEDDLEDFEDDAENLGLFAAYFCPANQINDEGSIQIDNIEGWGVSKTAGKRLRDLFSKRLQDGPKNPQDGRGALYSIYAEADAWGDFIEDYEDMMGSYMTRLSWTSLLSLVASIAAMYFAPRFPFLIVLALLLAGATGSCISVMAKRPPRDATLSGELDAYGKRVLTRIGVGVAASLIGCGFLGWGVLPISIQNQTFAGALDVCASSSSCAAAIKALLVLAVAMLLGFSERALTSFESRILGELHSSRKKR